MGKLKSFKKVGFIIAMLVNVMKLKTSLTFIPGKAVKEFCCLCGDRLYDITEWLVINKKQDKSAIVGQIGIIAMRNKPNATNSTYIKMRIKLPKVMIRILVCVASVAFGDLIRILMYVELIAFSLFCICSALLGLGL